MKRTIIFILILLLISAQASALDSGSFAIKVTINKPPEITGFEPGDGDTVTQGNTLKISVNATDQNVPDNAILEYHFIVKDENDKIRREKDWSHDSEFSYELEESDLGLNIIKVEVTDGIETVPKQEIEIYVFRKSPALPTL